MYLRVRIPENAIVYQNLQHILYALDFVFGNTLYHLLQNRLRILIKFLNGMIKYVYLN